MNKSSGLTYRKDYISEQRWPWWPLLPLYPYGRRRTLFKELIPDQIWSFEQLQGLYYVAVPVRLTVVKVAGGLMLFNPLPPTTELLENMTSLQKDYGPVLSIILPTASGLEHKISLPALSRAFPRAELWVSPGLWSFPFDLPLDFLGIPSNRTKTLFKDGLPHEDSCTWFSLGPLNLGLGRFQEISCFHKLSKSILVTDALVGIQAEPPDLFELDPTPLLFHSREKGSEPLIDTIQARKKGWARLVLFASYLRPGKLSIPPIEFVLRNAFRSGVRSPRAHFGIYPFSWNEDWQESLKELMGEKSPLINIAPVLKRLVFPRAKDSFSKWLDQISNLKGLRWLIPAHYSAPIAFNPSDAKRLKQKLFSSAWTSEKGDWSFLDGLDRFLFKNGVVPKDPLEGFKD